MENAKVKLFQNKEIRTLWNEKEEEYLFSVIDIIAVLTESKNPSQYWRTLKSRLNEESNQSVTICNKLKMPAKDGKMRLTDVANTKQALRIIQSVPSPNAEPFKQWLAKVGGERLDEIADPQIAINRAINYYRQKGYSEEWISQRFFGIELRKDLTAEWNRVGVEKSEEYGILTNEISKAWSGMTTKEYKKYKGLKKEGLRDNMTIMGMEDWAMKLDGFLESNEYDILDNKGHISMNEAKSMVEKEFEKFRPKQDRLYESDFDRLLDDFNKLNKD